MRLHAIPPHLPFLDAVAASWLADGMEPAEMARGMILLPTRRAARALAEAFLRAGGGRALLLPRITALGALDEAPLALAGALDLPPAVAPARRLAVLARLILGMEGRAGAPRTAERAWLLAAELARLMDEAEREGIDLAARLPDAADAAYAAHWQATLTFLEIVTRAWPDWLAEQGLMNPAAREVALLDAQSAAWTAAPPAERIWIAGTTGGIPAVARLLRVVARLPAGRVILPGLDPALDPDCVPEDGHPQSSLRRLLHGLQARPEEVAPWPEQAAPVAPGRAETLWRALLPASRLDLWRETAAPHIDGLFRLDAADQGEEAVAIALILRGALERPGARAALVTPDRDLAGRVAAELLRFGVVADDSAGEPLAETPPAVFLRLLAEAVRAGLAPVPLLALLKHPFAAAGQAPAATREAARRLELACLRGPRPAPGLAGLRRAAEAGGAATLAFLHRVETCLEPLLRCVGALEAPEAVSQSLRVAPAALLAALVEAGERLAATDAAPGPARLWAQEEGEALAARLADVQEALPVLPHGSPDGLPGLLDAVLEGAVVRSRRALRGRGGAEHPRVFIWGLLEARLQTADIVVLGGLAEGVWPPATDPGPWLSRPMRARVGLPSPEQAVGQAAHDFVMACCAAPVAVLSCPRRRDRAPAVPARWLARLDAYLAGRGLRLPTHPAATWARQLDRPAGPPRPVPPPRPNPPLALRPRKLSVTEIETWVRDPYAIHARHVLKLRPLDALEQATDAADYGTLVHAALHAFLEEAGSGWPEDAAARLRAVMDRVLREARLRPALEAWWSPRLGRIAAFVAALEAERRAENPPALLRSELVGNWTLDLPGGFRLTGRADRIERRDDGSLAILDYKTGSAPTAAEVAKGLAPQLLLEAAMAAAGAFGPELAGPAAELCYWELKGGHTPGSVTKLCKSDAAAIAAAVAEAEAGLRRLIASFDAGAPYLAQPHPGRAPRFPHYAQLARVAEWAALDEEPE